MKNKKGFISMTLVYGFLVLFMALMAVIIASYTERNNYLNYIKREVNNDISSIKFDKKSLMGRIIIDNDIADGGDLAIGTISNLKTDNGNGLFYIANESLTDENNDGVGSRIYFFRGAVENNNIVLSKNKDSGTCGRIIRTNEDGSIRIIIYGHAIGSNEDFRCDNTGSSIIFEPFSTIGNNTNAYVFSNDATSIVKRALQTYYDEKLIMFDNIIVNATYCQERNGGNIDTLQTYRTNQFPRLSLVCNDPNDRVNTKIALLTEEDFFYAGGADRINNKDIYLNFGKQYWTMSPYPYRLYNNPIVRYEVATVTEDGALSSMTATEYLHVFPVISLRANTSIKKGDGTANNPYLVTSY